MVASSVCKPFHMKKGFQTGLKLGSPNLVHLIMRHPGVVIILGTKCQRSESQD